jgi:hypothetical protein
MRYRTDVNRDALLFLHPVPARRATCLLANVSVSSTLSPCILHRSGHLRVERCLLECHSGGLDHLTSPIVTVATVSGPQVSSSDPASPDHAGASPTRSTRSLSFQTQAHTQLAPCSSVPHCYISSSEIVSSARKNLDAARSAKHPLVVTPAAASARPGNPLGDLSAGAGPGKLVVADTRLSGGGQGVQCRGTGVLQGVRAIYGTGRMPLFFFEVDAR